MRPAAASQHRTVSRRPQNLTRAPAYRSSPLQRTTAIPPAPSYNRSIRAHRRSPAENCALRDVRLRRTRMPPRPSDGFLSWPPSRKFRPFSLTSSVAPSSRRSFALRDDHSALDVVQDAMLKLTEKYSDKPAAELPLLFQRILQNTIHDHFRRQKVRTTWTTVLSALGRGDEKDDEFDPLETLRAKSDSNANADPGRAARTGADHEDNRAGADPGCRRVNGKPFCYVTGKSSMWRRLRSRWAARRAASRPIARVPSMPWPRCFGPKG